MHRAWILLFTILFAGCATKGNDGVTRVSDLGGDFKSVEQGVYTVLSGDSLSKIAHSYKTSISSIKKANNLNSSNIYAGQKLKIPGFKKYTYTASLNKVEKEPPRIFARKKSVATRARVSKYNSTSQSRANTRASATREKRPVIRPQKIKQTKSKPAINSNWAWPAEGKLVSNFSSGDSSGRGVHIQGRFGSSILAIDKGTVVYSGNALRGYGNLIIIKHKNNFLSAYAHNDKNIVKEGETVTKGQRIAQMGRYNNKEALLHFELRENGQPVDPERYIRSS